MEKYEILCYGDSNTFGTVARWSDSEEERKRYNRETRWPCVLQADLGEDCYVTEAGLPGRTSIYDSPEGWYLNGEKLLLPELLAHRPLDLVVILLGSNDLHLPDKLPEEKLGDGISRLIQIVREHPECGREGTAPDILVIAPPVIRKSSPLGRTSVYEKFFGAYGEHLSRCFAPVYRAVAEKNGCSFLSAADYAQPDEADGAHFTAQSHISLGHAVAEKVREIRQKRKELS